MAESTFTLDDAAAAAADVMAVDAAVMRSTGADAYGVTADGFLPKPFARLLAEKLALARALLGEDLDLTSGSVVRKMLEVASLEDARTWAALSAMYDNSFITSATGEALSRLGDEQGLPRPFLEARGTVQLQMKGKIPNNKTELTIPSGSRMLTPGGHHVATVDAATFTETDTVKDVGVIAFYPGPSHNLDPAPLADGTTPQKIGDWNRDDPKLAALVDAESAVNSNLSLEIHHTQRLTGGELRWSDARYRQLLLRAPRSLWSVDAILLAVAQVPGVRQARVHDAWGGLDVRQSIFGNFNFIERVFNSERDLGSPYYFTLVVAATESAIWDGPDGLRAAVQSAVEDLRPIGIFPDVQPATEVPVGVHAKLVIKDYPLVRNAGKPVNELPAAIQLKRRLHERLRGYVGRITMEEAVVRAAEVTQVLMNDPAVADVQELKLLRFPPRQTDFAVAIPAAEKIDPQEFKNGENFQLQGDQVPVYVDDDAQLIIA